MITIIYVKCVHYVQSNHPLLFSRLAATNLPEIRLVEATSIKRDELNNMLSRSELIVLDHSVIEAYRLSTEGSGIHNHIYIQKLNSPEYYTNILSAILNSDRRILYWASMTDPHGVLTVEMSKLASLGITYKCFLSRINGIIWYYNGEKLIDTNTIKCDYKDPWVDTCENPIQSYRTIQRFVSYEVEIPHCISTSDFVTNSKLWDFYIPGINYRTRQIVDNYVNSLRIKRVRLRQLFYLNGKVDAFIKKTRLISLKHMFLKNYLLMQYIVSRTSVSFVCGSCLRYFVRKFLEVPAFGSVMIAYPPSNMEDYGFIDNQHYLKIQPEAINEILLDILSDKERQIYLRENARELIRKLHTVDKRAEQLTNSLIRIANKESTKSYFQNGQYVFT